MFLLKKKNISFSFIWFHSICWFWFYLNTAWRRIAAEFKVKVFFLQKYSHCFIEFRSIQIKLGWALFVTYTIIQSIMRSEMCSLHLTHPSVHTWSSGQPTVQRPGSSRGLPAGAGIRTHNLGLPRVSSPTLYPGQWLPLDWTTDGRWTTLAKLFILFWTSTMLLSTLSTVLFT